MDVNICKGMEGSKFVDGSCLIFKIGRTQILIHLTMYAFKFHALEVHTLKCHASKSVHSKLSAPTSVHPNLY